MKQKRVRSKNYTLNGAGERKSFMKNNKKTSWFAKGMALFLALLMIASVVFAVVAYVQAA